MHLTGEALTFDDVSLVPAYSEVLPKDVSLKTRLTTGLNLNVPLVSVQHQYMITEAIEGVGGQLMATGRLMISIIVLTSILPRSAVGVTLRPAEKSKRLPS